ncbi:sigma-70 family RNA polymerase sigma factor [bacterium]|nr:sigma-70 family RNA polymerase sigma factor [bacterium]
MFDQVELNQLYQYAMALCQQREDAYDILQSSLEKYLIELQRGGRTIRNDQSYMRRLIRNRFIDLYRHQQRWANEPFEEASSYDISPVSLEQYCIDADSLEKIWQKISPQDRDILYHWVVLGYSTDEACEQLDMSRGSFLSRIHRLRKRLQASDGDTEKGATTL